MLVPNSAVQMQWMRLARSFTDDPRLVASDAAQPGWELLCLTYQSLAQIDDPEVALGRLAAARWAAERAAATGGDAEAIDREAAGWGPTHPAAERRRRELARIGASIKREIAQGRHEGVRLADLLAAPARERVRRLAAAQVGAVVLDECHHLASLWGYVVRAALGELTAGSETPHVIGLTATPPSDLTGEETELYGELLGPVDFTVPTPAVVRDGHLAPFQELAWITEPLDSERAWLAEHDTRFRELVTALHDDAEGPLSFPGWVITRVRERRRGPDDETEVSWEAFQRRSPALARAGVRFLASAGPAPARRRPARRGVPPPARPRGLARAALGLRAALPGRLRGPRGREPLRGDRRRTARARLPAHAPGDPARRIGGRPAADRLAREGARAGRGDLRRGRGARRRAARRWCSATPSSPPPVPTTR